MIIEKTAIRRQNFYNRLSFYNNARQAFEAVLRKLILQGKYELLLPDYIGISSREGSGIYDPVLATGIQHNFYHLNRELQIDLTDFSKKLRGSEKKIVLLVHYFGMPDDAFSEVVEICKKNDAIIIEDAAHALFSDYVDHVCGRIGHYVLYSLHKMLPFSDGGMMKENFESRLKFDDINKQDYNVFSYDFYEIANKRKKNTKKWYDLLVESELYPIYIKPLRQYRSDVTYQTFPVVVNGELRDKLYFGLNDKGYGAVSLYHELIAPLKNSEHEDTCWLADHILNLPVHQDVSVSSIAEMFTLITEIIGSGENGL